MKVNISPVAYELPELNCKMNLEYSALAVVALKKISANMLKDIAFDY